MAAWVMYTVNGDGSCAFVGLVGGWFFSEYLYESIGYAWVRGVGRALRVFGAVVGVFFPDYPGVYRLVVRGAVRDQVFLDHCIGRGVLDCVGYVRCVAFGGAVSTSIVFSYKTRE